MPARPWGSVHRFVSTGVAVGAFVFAPPLFDTQTTALPRQGLLAVGRVHAEETVESPGVPSRAGGEAPKLRASRPVAKDSKAKDPKAKEVVAAPDAAATLGSELRKASSDDQAIAVLKKLGELGSPRAVEILLGELAIGMSPRATKAALDVLAARKGDAAAAAGMPNAFPVLSLYAHHRNPELRKQALAALAALPAAPATDKSAPPATPGAAAKDATANSAPGPVVQLLIAALSDPNSDVRAVAAEALGKRHETRAEPQLIKLLLRKDGAAPAALGQIGGPDTARALAEMIGNVPDSMILETLGHLLERPDFGPEPVRVQVVKTVGKMPGAQTLDILGDYVKDTAKDKQRPSRIEAQKIIEQRTAK